VSVDKDWASFRVLVNIGLRNFGKRWISPTLVERAFVEPDLSIVRGLDPGYWNVLRVCRELCDVAWTGGVHGVEASRVAVAIVVRIGAINVFKLCWTPTLAICGVDTVELDIAGGVEEDESLEEAGTGHMGEVSAVHVAACACGGGRAPACVGRINIPGDQVSAVFVCIMDPVGSGGVDCTRPDLSAGIGVDEVEAGGVAPGLCGAVPSHYSATLGCV